MTREYKTYKRGDLITVSVTKGFEDVATDFFQYCGKNGINPSEIIRKMIYHWLTAHRNRTQQDASVPKPIRIPTSKKAPQEISDEIFRQVMEEDGL
jgi:hypothetical protein